MKTTNYKTDNLQFFAVTVKAGHGGAGNYGRGYFVPLTLNIMAADAKEAAERARWTKRVKHHDKSAILNVRKIDRDTYMQIKKQNNDDLFLKVTSIQEQRLLVDMTDRICYEPELVKKEKEEKPKLFKNKFIRNPKKFFTRYYDDSTAHEYDYEAM